MIHLSSMFNCAMWISHAMYYFYHGLTKECINLAISVTQLISHRTRIQIQVVKRGKGNGGCILSFSDQEHTPNPKSEAGEKDRRNDGDLGGDASWPMSF